MQTNLETTLSQLISFPSVSSNPQACREIIEFVRGQIAPYNLHITGDFDADNPWLIATTQATKTPDILLATHLDVVPAPTELFTMQTRDGKLYGRGAYDMKHAAACFIELAKAHAEELKQLDIGFMFTTDEEIGGYCVPSILELGWRPGLVFIPDGSDNWQIEERAKGFYDFEISAPGRSAHGSRPWEGDNALHTLLDTLAILRHSYPSSSPDDATLAITAVHSGDAVNQIPDSASAKIDFRTFSEHDIAVYRAQVEQLAAKNGLKLDMVIEGAPVSFDKTAPAVQGFLRALHEQTGEPPRYTQSYGGTDARHFAKYGVPCVVTSPNGGGRHSPEEWLLASDLASFYQLLERWLLGVNAQPKDRIPSTLLNRVESGN